jgi:hypothetical protein
MLAWAELIPDDPVDPLDRQGIETEGQQLPVALNLDGQGTKTLSPAHMIKLTATREITPYRWVHRGKKAKQ